MSSLDELLYKEKYLKYKKKYIKLKEYQGGGINQSYIAYIFATKNVIDEFKRKFIKLGKNFNEVKSFFDKQGYIIENSKPSLIKLINNNGILTKHINSASNNIKQNINNDSPISVKLEKPINYNEKFKNSKDDEIVLSDISNITNLSSPKNMVFEKDLERDLTKF